MNSRLIDVVYTCCPICLSSLTVGGYGKEFLWQAVQASFADTDYQAHHDPMNRDARNRRTGVTRALRTEIINPAIPYVLRDYQWLPASIGPIISQGQGWP